MDAGNQCQHRPGEGPRGDRQVAGDRQIPDAMGSSRGVTQLRLSASSGRQIAAAAELRGEEESDDRRANAAVPVAAGSACQRDRLGAPCRRCGQQSGLSSRQLERQRWLRPWETAPSGAPAREQLSDSKLQPLVGVQLLARQLAGARRMAMNRQVAVQRERRLFSLSPRPASASGTREAAERSA